MNTNQPAYVSYLHRLCVFAKCTLMATLIMGSKQLILHTADYKTSVSAAASLAREVLPSKCTHLNICKSH